MKLIAIQNACGSVSRDVQWRNQYTRYWCDDWIARVAGWPLVIVKDGLRLFLLLPQENACNNNNMYYYHNCAYKDFNKCLLLQIKWSCVYLILNMLNICILLSHRDVLYVNMTFKLRLCYIIHFNDWQILDDDVRLIQTMLHLYADNLLYPEIYEVIIIYWLHLS